jgi:hypothetical protein
MQKLVTRTVHGFQPESNMVALLNFVGKASEQGWSKREIALVVKQAMRNNGRSLRATLLLYSA